MRVLSLPIIVSLILLDIVLFAWIISKNFHLTIFDPAGLIAQQERMLFLSIAAFGLTIIGTVIITTFYVIWRYREDNPQAGAYHPEWTNKKLMIFWWIFPSLIIAIVGTVTWISTHRLDPYKPIQSDVKPLTVQVVSLQWRWLFIYPEQHIATINYLVFPEKTPINFELTADSPMNSFWIPQLGGQMYSMSGMVTHTHLLANRTGEFKGSTAEISGAGFAGMRFIAKATTDQEFNEWVEQVKQTNQTLDKPTYKQVAKPSEDSKVILYSSVDESLYNSIVMKYMPHPSEPNRAMNNPESHTETRKSMHDMSM